MLIVQGTGRGFSVSSALVMGSAADCLFKQPRWDSLVGVPSLGAAQSQEQFPGIVRACLCRIVQMMAAETFVVIG